MAELKRTRRGISESMLSAIVDLVIDSLICYFIHIQYGWSIAFFCFGVLRTLNQILYTLNATE